MTQQARQRQQVAEQYPGRRRDGRGHQWFWRLFPLLWLAYLLYPISSFWGRHTPAEDLLAAAALLVFLALWLAVYLRRDHTWGHLSWVLAAFSWSLLLYALGLPVVGYDSVAFAVYAAGLIGYQRRLRIAALGTLAVVVAVFLPVRFHLHVGLVTPATALTFAVFALVAAAGNHAGYRQRMYRLQLEQAEREQERLTQAAERERIARDLHDLLGHTLSVIVLKSELAARLAERDPARAAAEIRDVERISRGALSEVRAAVSGYRGSGFHAELARSKLALDTAGVQLNYLSAGDQREALSLPPEVEYVMEMVLREAVTNVVRHAQARTVTVRVGQERGSYELEVDDDGVGLRGATEGTGLTGMRERVWAHGGELTRYDGNAQGGRGTVILARFPVRTETPSAQPSLAQVAL